MVYTKLFRHCKGFLKAKTFFYQHDLYLCMIRSFRILIIVVTQDTKGVTGEQSGSIAVCNDAWLSLFKP